MGKFAINGSGAMLLPSLVQVSESISGSVVPLAMFWKLFGIFRYFFIGATSDQFRDFLLGLLYTHKLPKKHVFVITIIHYHHHQFVIAIVIMMSSSSL